MEPNTQTDSPAEMHPEPHHEKNTGMAIVAYLLFFVPLLTESKNDPFVKFHVKQGFLLFVGWLVAYVILMTPLMPLAWLVQLGVVALMVLGIVHAAQGKEEPLPVVGQFASKVTFL